MVWALQFDSSTQLYIPVYPKNSGYDTDITIVSNNIKQIL